MNKKEILEQVEKILEKRRLRERAIAALEKEGKVAKIPDFVPPISQPKSQPAVEGLGMATGSPSINVTKPEALAGPASHNHNSECTPCGRKRRK